ncbi:MAG TPA: M14 family zinc carboxypeptidase [Candidatus Thermoplasmatota archaeon]|nr:M14 family zinc carboxypeptidase [Candidatus Thermoplasmatota archaeon]
MGIATLSGAAFTALGATPHGSDSVIAKVTFSQPTTLDLMERHGIATLTVDKAKTYAVVLASPEDLVWLASMHLSSQIVLDSTAEQHGWKYGAGLEDTFHTYAQMTAILQNISTTYPDITQLYDLGHSVQGRTIWGLKVTSDPTIEEDKPQVRMCGNHHGNEKMGTELCLLLAQYLTNYYGVNDTITSLVDTREIWIIPMVNPDGHEMNTRENANGVDLNRDYGYMWGGWGGSSAPFSQPETQAIRANAVAHNFVLSLSFHTSADVVNYVWNYKHQRAPDNTVLEYLSNQYGNRTGYWVTEGYDWYQTMGDTNDFSYGCRGDLDWTIETDNTNIQGTWNLNREAMFDIIKAADMELRGIVTDAQTGQPVAATVWVQEALWPCFTNPVVGDYHKPLMPGSYHVTVHANGYQDAEFTVDVGDGQPTWLNVTLSRADGYYAYQITVARYYAPSDNFQSNPTEAISVLGPPDGIYAAIGVGGYLVVDMRDNITDASGPDFQVDVVDGTDNGYQVYGSLNWNGPWTSLGSGMGTTLFDLADTALDTVHYLKIMDDGSGNPNAQNPGCHIDAIENLAAVSPDQPPNTPAQPQGPVTGAFNVSYSYSTSTSDPEGQQVFYQWSWGDEVSDWFGPYDSGAVSEATHSWAAAGQYAVKVKAKDTVGYESAWSAPLTVRIEAGADIELGSITGGLGVSAIVENKGVAAATDVNWSITLTGGLVLFGRHSTGTLSVVEPGVSQTIRSKFLFGIGSVTITVTAATAQEQVKGFLFGPIIILRK